MRLMTVRAAGAAVVLACAGCASMQPTVDTVKEKATQLAQSTRAHAQAVYQRQQHYLAEHEVLKNFEDATEHSESEVLKVLHAARKNSAVVNSTKASISPPTPASRCMPSPMAM